MIYKLCVQEYENSRGANANRDTGPHCLRYHPKVPQFSLPMPSTCDGCRVSTGFDGSGSLQPERGPGPSAHKSHAHCHGGFFKICQDILE